MEFAKRTLSSIVKIISGGTPSTKNPEFWNGTIGWLSVADFNNDHRFVTASEKTITELGLNNSSTKVLSVGDIIISARGTVGALSQIGKEMAFNQSCFGLRAKKDFLHEDFLYYSLKNYVKNLKAKSQGSVFDTINLSTFDMIELEIPSLPNQEKIASVLSTLDEKIALNNQINATLEQMAKTLYDYWFVQFDFPDDNGKPYKSSGGEMVYNETLKRDIPIGWNLGSVKDYCPSTAGYAFKSSEWTVTGNPVIKIKNIQDNQTLDVKDIDFVNLTNRKIDNKFKAEAGNIVIAMTGATIGKFALVPKAEIDFYINQRVGYFDLGENPVARLPFLINSLNMDYFRDAIFTLASGAAQPNISNAQINDIILLTPPNELIKRFNSMVSANYESILNNQFANQKLAELRDWLLPMLMNGQVTVK